MDARIDVMTIHYRICVIESNLRVFAGLKLPGVEVDMHLQAGPTQFVLEKIEFKSPSANRENKHLE